ncbi:hypothetical protein PIB30_075270 [Stylosanthes scabra]|uniref:Uncharacterized protein n=1 Tax=Stylosanthes scabra TaxID=79078 RepID=A0ABU6SRV2_9FABA|nr:hypothetical protein [Stylosanthes scabra]
MIVQKNPRGRRGNVAKNHDDREANNKGGSRFNILRSGEGDAQENEQVVSGARNVVNRSWRIVRDSQGSVTTVPVTPLTNSKDTRREGVRNKGEESLQDKYNDQPMIAKDPTSSQIIPNGENGTEMEIEGPPMVLIRQEPKPPDIGFETQGEKAMGLNES